MKFVFLSLLLLLSWGARAENDLDIDDHFFRSDKGSYDDDELDRATKKDPLAVGSKQQMKVDSAVKNEFNSVQPGVMKSYEAAEMDRAVVRENQRRDKAILKKIAENTPAIKLCVEKDKQNFHGTHIKMAWMIDAQGKVLEAAVRSTDIQNPEVEKCIYEASLKLKFSEAATEHLKQSVAEYTYKFNVKSRTPTSANSSVVTTSGSTNPSANPFARPVRAKKRPKK